MGKKMTTKTTTGAVFSFDTGNGSAQGVSSDNIYHAGNVLKAVYEFEPIMAPLTRKRDLAGGKQPHYSLREDKAVYVFGLADVTEHGSIRDATRLNTMNERVTSPDYAKMLDVLLLHAFPRHAGNAEPIVPAGVVSLPISLYNQPDVAQELVATLVSTGKREIRGADDCPLLIHLQPENVLVLPESVGAMTHYAFDPDTLTKRGDVGGVNVVVDIGFQTTDVSVFEGMRYIRDASFTVDVGMGIVARAITDGVTVRGTALDVSRVDRGIRALADKTPGVPMQAEIAPGQFADVTEIYDDGIASLATQIANDVRTRFAGNANRVLLSGGGAFHLCSALRNKLSAPVVMVPDAGKANVVGAYTMLALKAQRQ